MSRHAGQREGHAPGTGDALDVVFLALARDCAETLPGLISFLQSLRQTGMRCCAVIGENGSQDGTRRLLEAAAETGLVRVADTAFMSSVPTRVERMALGRNFLADQVRALPGAAAVCVVDVDEPFSTHLDPRLFRSALDRVQSDGVFAVAATSRPTYYDVLAFEDDTRSYAFLEERIQELQRTPLRFCRYYRLFRDVMYPAQEELTSKEDIFCVSAFNGLCLYTRETYLLGSYLPPDAQTWICEHVTFHRSLARATGRSMVIDPRLVLPMPAEHGRRTFFGFVVQRLRKAAVSLRR